MAALQFVRRMELQFPSAGSQSPPPQCHSGYEAPSLTYRRGIYWQPPSPSECSAASQDTGRRKNTQLSYCQWSSSSRPTINWTSWSLDALKEWPCIASHSPFPIPFAATENFQVRSPNSVPLIPLPYLQKRYTNHQTYRPTRYFTLTSPFWVSFVFDITVMFCSARLCQSLSILATF